MSRKVNVQFHDGSSRNIKVNDSKNANVDKIKERSEFKKERSSTMSGIQTGGSLFCLIVGILIFVAVIRMLGGYGSVSFQTLLETLANAPSIQMPLTRMIDMFTISTAWPVLDGLRLFINSLGSIIAVLDWCVLGLYQCVIYLAHFIGFIFVG